MVNSGLLLEGQHTFNKNNGDPNNCRMAYATEERQHTKGVQDAKRKGDMAYDEKINGKMQNDS